MSTPLAFALAAISDYFVWWQLPLLLGLIGLIGFLVWNKRRQM